MSGYIGTQPVPQATQTRDVFTATSGQTTFATSGYTPNFLDVWLNGVKLVNGDDFTATNGSDVVLTSGATAGDTVEVLSYSTFEVANRNFTGDTSAENFTVTGTFTSRGIDDNATSTAVTLDASGNVLVGTASAYGAGLTVEQTGLTYIKRNNTGLVVNRTGTDGQIAAFEKDGTTVGGIGTDTTLGKLKLNGTNESGLQFHTNSILPVSSGNSILDNAVDIGNGAVRFKNLYLSGGVYLGGTGAANLLDDYEEGTWTPSFVNGTWSYNSRFGKYIRVGNMVTVWYSITWGSKSGAGGLEVGNLPFTPFSGDFAARAGGSLGTHTGLDTAGGKQLITAIDGSINKIMYRFMEDNASWSSLDISVCNGVGEVQGTFTYRA